MKVTVNGNYVMCSCLDGTWQTGILIEHGKTAGEALTDYAREARVKAAELIRRAERAEQACESMPATVRAYRRKA